MKRVSTATATATAIDNWGTTENSFKRREAREQKFKEGIMKWTAEMAVPVTKAEMKKVFKNDAQLAMDTVEWLITKRYLSIVTKNQLMKAKFALTAKGHSMVSTGNYDFSENKPYDFFFNHVCTGNLTATRIEA